MRSLFLEEEATKSLSSVIKNPVVKINREKTVYIEFNQELQGNLAVDQNRERNSENDDILLKSRKNAEKIVLEAQERADQILKQAREDAEIIKMKNEEEGRKQGYHEGFRQGSEEAQMKLKQTEIQLQEGLLKEKERIIQDLEPKIVHLILNISEKILGNALKLNKQSILYLIRKGLSEVQNQDETIIIRISEEDYFIVTESKNDILDSFGFTGRVEITKDLSLRPGGCIIETQYGNIDCGFGTQFEGLREELLLMLSSS